MTHRILFPLSAVLVSFVSISVAQAANEGQADLDKATELKVTANDLRDLNQVIELLDSALEKGLDADNTDFAETMLVGTLLQRASALSSAILNQPTQGGRRDPRWIQIRQFALTDLQRAVTLNENQYDAHLLIGRLHSLPLGDPNAARKSLTKVIEAGEEIAPQVRSEAYALRGAVQPDAEKRADFDKALELEPEKADYLLLRARHHYSQQQWDQAMADIDAAVKLEPESFPAHELRALILLAQDKSDEALESFNRASELSPKAVSPYQYRGELYRQLGDTNQAIEQLNKAIELSPDNFMSLAMRSELLFRSGKPEEALKDVDAALKLQPAMVNDELIRRTRILRVRLLEELDRGDEALTELEQLAKAAPEDPATQLQLAAYYIDKQRTNQAIEALGRVIKLDSDSTLALRMRGDLYLTTGQHAEAIEDFAAALAQEPEESSVLNNYAWTLATSPVDKLRDGKRAIEMATKACELTDYKAPHILSTLAASYAEAGDFAKAIEWAEKAIELDKAENNGEHQNDLKKELVSYREKKPFRELQQLDEADVEESEKEFFAPPSATPAPARTIDL